MDSKIDNFKEEIDFTDNNDKLDKLKKSYLILKQKVCRSHDLIKLYNDKLKECERMKIDLELANKETKKMTSNYNLTLAKVIKLELQNAEYKKDIESLTNTIVTHETKMAGDRQHLQQLTCKMKELEENYMDKIMQLDLDKSLLQENIKELKCQLKISNKNCDSSKRKTNKKQNIENDSESTTSTADVAVNTISSVISTVDIAVNTVGSDVKHNTLIEKNIMTDISCNIDKDDPYPLFCNECERILSNPCDKICRSMTKHPQLIEMISSPIKSLHTESVFSTTGKDENVENCYDNDEICNLVQSSEDLNTHNNTSNQPIVSLKPLKPRLISESTNQSNITSPKSLHVLEKLEEKMKRLEKKIKKQSRKKKQLSTNHLQYFPHMNYYPNDILSQNLSLNMASAFWNEVKNLMNNKQNNCVENQKKKHESKLCKFSSKKIKLKHRLRQKNRLLHNNAWNIDSITSCPIQPMAVDNSTITNHLERSSIDTLSNLTNNNATLHNFSSDINFDKNKYSDALIEENTKHISLFSSPKKTLRDTDIQEDESTELSSFEDIKDNMSSFMEDSNSSDFNNTQCYTPTVKIITHQTNDIPFTAGKCDTKNKNNLKNTITSTSTTTTTTTTTTSNTSTTNTAVINDTIMVNDIDATTSKVSTINTSTTINDKYNEDEINKEASIPDINEISHTEFTVTEISQIYNNVPSRTTISNSIGEYKVDSCTTTAANSITVADTCLITNFATTTTCLTSSITTTTNTAATTCRSKRTNAVSTGIVTRAQKRKFLSNSQMNLFTVKRNNKIVNNFENDEVSDDEITRDTFENEIDNKSDTSEDCTSPKKLRISDEMKISDDQEVLTEHLNANEAVDDVTVPLICKVIEPVTTCLNLNKRNNCNDILKNNALISKEGKSTEATTIHSSSFVTNEEENECMEEESNSESFKAGHSNTRIKNVDLHTKGRFLSMKTSHIRLMEHLKNLRSRPPSKITDFELFRSNEPIIPDTENNNKDKCTPQVVHNKDDDMKNNEDKCLSQNTCNKNNGTKNNVDKCRSQILCTKNNEVKHNEDKCTSQISYNKKNIQKPNDDIYTSEISCNKSSKLKYNDDICTPEIFCNKNEEIKHNEDKCTTEILYNKSKEIKHTEDECTFEISCNKNKEIKHNEEKCTTEVLSNRDSEIKDNGDICTPEILYNRSKEIKYNEDKCTPETSFNENSKLKHNDDICIPEILCNKNNEIKHNEDKYTPEILSNRNSEMKRDEDKYALEILPNRNSEVKHNDDRRIPEIVSNRNSEVKSNIINNYNNMYGKEEYKLQSKSVESSIQGINEISQESESDQCSDKYSKNLEKNSDPANVKEHNVIQNIIDEKQKLPRINSIKKYNRIDFVVATTTTETAIPNENKVDSLLNNMEMFASENTEKIDNNASTSLNVVSPVTLLQNYFYRNKKPIGLRTTKKVLKDMADICKATGSFVNFQLTRIIDNDDWAMSVHVDVVDKLCTACPVRIVAHGIVEFMLERPKSNLDNTYTPPAPLMTLAQQRITALLVDLEKRMPTVIKLVQAGIEYKLFRLNKTPMFHEIQNLVRLYVVLARIQKDRAKVRMFCCDALYCIGLEAIPVCYAALTSWPEIFPQFTENTEVLPKCMAHIISNIQAVDFPQLEALKHLITAYYKFRSGDYVTENLMDESLKSLEEHHSGAGVVSLKTAIILLAKKEGVLWTHKNVIHANLLPNIVNRKYSSMFDAFSLLGCLLRTFPVDDNNSIVKNIIEQLSDLIESGEGSEDQQEGIVSALLSLSRHNFDKVAESVMKWTPTKPMRATTIDQYTALFSFRSTMHWKGFIRHAINKV